MMQNPLSEGLARAMQAISAAIDHDRDYLSELDGAIGDADHGITMSMGFQAACNALLPLPPASAPRALMEAAAGAFLDAVGASTGPLYATALRRAGLVLGDKETCDGETIAAMLQAFAEGIAERGKGGRGDKTMLDAWLPAAEAAALAVQQRKSTEALWRDAVSAAEAGAEATRSMVAARGRAKRLGERAIGHVDPGAASAVIVIRAMARTFGQR